MGFADLLRLAKSYNQQAATWDEGDFNFDRAVTFAHLLTLAQQYGKGQAASLLDALRSGD